MVSRRSLAPVVATLVVLAGCPGLWPSPTETPVATPLGTDPGTADPPGTADRANTAVATAPSGQAGRPETPTPTPVSTHGPPDERDVVVTGAPLPVNASLVLDRVEGLTGIDVSGTVTLVVRSGTPGGTAGPNGTAVDDAEPFYDLLGLTGRLEPPDTTPGGVTAPDGETVTLWPGDAPAVRIEQALAHEFAHVVETELLGDVSRFYGPPSDENRAGQAVLEGGAMLVERAYVGRYHPDVRWRRPWSFLTETGYERLPDRARLGLSRYYYGYRYVTGLVESPGGLKRALDRVPETTERLLHPDRGTDSTERLRVLVFDGSWEQFDEPVRRGEMATRATLRAELNASLATRAAAGWGDDRTVAFRRGDRTALVWVWRADTRADAAEVGRAFRRFADARDPVHPADFAVRRVTDRTVALVAGHGSFLASVTVRHDGENLVVSTADTESTNATPSTVGRAVGTGSATRGRGL